MKILHTSDWHLGRSLYGRKRYEEFTAFLDWLAGIIVDEKIDALLVAGDIFDNATPGNRAQELYYRFLCRVAGSCCRHIIITGGNHDSPSFLNAPRELLKALNVHVVGAVTGDLRDEVILLRDGKGDPEAVVCAVPYLRDRDLRTVEAGESMDDKNIKLLEGLRDHYREVCALAEEVRRDAAAPEGREIPLIAMGHLFTAGGQTTDGDGVRELYVGSLAHAGTEIFPEGIDYLALGHLHVPQKAGGKDNYRYSGSPLPMGFGEARQKKRVLIVEFTGSVPAVREAEIPRFQELEKVAGSLDEILSRIAELGLSGSSAWLEIEYTGREVTGDLRQILEEALEGSSLEIRRIRNRRVMDRVMQLTDAEDALEDLSPRDVFSRCMDAGEVPQEDRDDLMESFREILQSVREADVRAE